MRKVELLKRIESLEGSQTILRKQIAELTERVRRVESVHAGYGPLGRNIAAPIWPTGPKDTALPNALAQQEGAREI